MLFMLATKKQVLFGGCQIDDQECTDDIVRRSYESSETYLQQVFIMMLMNDSLAMAENV